MAGAGDVPAGGRVRHRPRRRPFRSRFPVQRRRRQGRQSRLSLRRAEELRLGPAESHFCSSPAQLVSFYDFFPGARPDRCERARARAEGCLPGSATPAVPDPAPLGRARLDRFDRLEMDPRLPLQRDQLGARSVPPGQTFFGADVAGRAEARHDLGHPRPYLAHASVRHRHHPRGLDRDPEGHSGGGGCRWSRLLPAAVPDPDSDDAADHERGRPFRRHLHFHGHDRDLHPHARRALRHHPGSPLDGVLHGNPGRRPRRRRSHLDLPRPPPRPRGVVDVAHRPPVGDRVMAVGMRVRRLGGRMLHWMVLATFCTLLAFPFYWMLITSFKSTRDLYDLKNNPFIFNESPTLEHLRLLFRETLFLRWLGNTAFAGLVVVVITLVLAVPAAYALARLTGRWGGRVGIGIFLTYLVPPTLLFIPLSRIVAWLGLQDTLWAVIVVYPSFTIPFSTWLLMGFFKSIPAELEDAAMVDGLTRFQAFLKLVIPISVSGILTVVIFTFTLVSQEFVYALTFISSAAHQTVGVGVPVYLVRGDVYYWGSLMAACLVASLPIAVLYNLFLDRFIAGFTVGSVK